MTVDTTAPSAPLFTSLDGDVTLPYVTPDTTPDVVVQTTVGDSISITGWTCTPTPAVGATVTCTPVAPVSPDGLKTYAVYATDPAGNVSVDSTLTFTLDATDPTLVTAVVDGTTLTLTYDETLNSSSVPLTTDFVVSGKIVTGVTVAGLTVVLTLTPGAVV